jgi:crossover junction endodeoxyribonuclease RuvC
MNLLTLDLATKLGFSVGPISHAQPEFGSYQLPQGGEDVGAFAWAYDKWLSTMLSKHSVKLVVFEAPSMFGFKKSNPKTVLRLTGLIYDTEKICYGKVPVRQANPSSVKKYWTGNGRAEKPAMIAIAEQNGFDVGRDDDAADALAVRFYAIHKMYPQYDGMVTLGVAGD